MDAILTDFRNKMNREDIVIRFYEDFLASYKPKMREKRGVYYTPEPVVSYMVRSVDELIKDKFNKPLGIADPEVMILDPACGTGTFLLWIFQLIHQRFQENPEQLIPPLLRGVRGDQTSENKVRGDQTRTIGVSHDEKLTPLSSGRGVAHRCRFFTKTF